MVEFLSMMDEETKQDIVRVYDAVTASLSLPKNIKVNLTILTKEEIKDLNSRTRNIDKVTDVLSYPYTNLKVGEKLNLEDYKFDVDPTDDLLLFGDVFICLERAKEQAQEYGHTLKREMCFLFCHSMLHLAGYDHMTPQDEKVMFDLQNKILDGLNITRTSFKSGFVTIIGDTNMGKSTLINTLVKEHVAIVSPKSETTRENIVGVYNDDNCQIVFLDTPGYHKHSAKIDAEMDKQISVAVEDTEIILMLISAKKPLVEQYNSIIKRVSSTAKKILLINKIDEVKYEKLYPELAKLNEILAVDEVLPISALTGKNCDVLLDIIKRYLPSYDHELRYYPIDEYTDKNLRHMCAEIIRE
ncbi:MAG: GTPase Era, partial [Clostridia bacterium]|nr:GTPase Era [Clostridia bacterium]